jgi:hypothetical protein
MGSSAVRRYFHPGGHPTPGSGFANSLNLVRSGNGGLRRNKRGLEGEAEFHLIADGYDTPAVYVYNPSRIHA